MQKFLNEFGYYDSKNRNKFNCAYQMFDNGIMKIKGKQYIRGLLQILGSIGKHKEIWQYAKDIFKYKTICRKQL